MEARMGLGEQLYLIKGPGRQGCPVAACFSCDDSLTCIALTASGGGGLVHIVEPLGVVYGMATKATALGVLSECTGHPPVEIVSPGKLPAGYLDVGSRGLVMACFPERVSVYLPGSGLLDASSIYYASEYAAVSLSTVPGGGGVVYVYWDDASACAVKPSRGDNLPGGSTSTWTVYGSWELLVPRDSVIDSGDGWAVSSAVAIPLSPLLSATEAYAYTSKGLLRITGCTDAVASPVPPVERRLRLQAEEVILLTPFWAKELPCPLTEG